jgi:hypothetical protein
MTGEEEKSNDDNKHKDYDKRRKPGKTKSPRIRCEGIKLKVFEESKLPPIDKPCSFSVIINQINELTINLIN